MTPSFSISDALSFGWRTFKTRVWFFIGVSVVLFIGAIVLSGIAHALLVSAFGKTLGGLLGALFSLVVNSLVGIGLLNVYLKAHDSVMTPTYADLWRPERFLNYLGVYVLLIVILLVGFILLIVPGVICMLMFMFAPLLVVEKGLSPIEALQESARLTRGHRVHLFLFALASAALNVIGTLVLVIGLLVSIPVTMLALVHVYRARLASVALTAAPAP